VAAAKGRAQDRVADPEPPIPDEPDVSLRGLTFDRTGSLRQSRQLAAADPAVRAGRLTVEIMTWHGPPGTMTRPGRRVWR
jgi:uncharacterized protein